MPKLPWRLLHLLALATMAVTQPLLNLLGENPTFFTAHHASPGQIITFSLLTALLPATVLGALLLAAHALSDSLGRRVHLGIVAVLIFIFLLQVVDVVPGPALIVILLAGAATYGFVVLYISYEQARSAVSILAIVPPAVVGLFLFSSPASSVVFPDDIEAVPLEDLLGEDPLGEDIATDDERGPGTSEQLNARFPPIYLLVLDELPWASLLDENGDIDAIRYPNFARLGATSHVFANATTVGFTTEMAVPALLASSIETQPAPVYSMYPDNLFTLLGGIYDVSASDPLVDLCPPTVCDGAPPSAIVELLATDEAGAPIESSTTAPPRTTISAATDTPAPIVEPRSRGSLSLLFEDAAIVFGHLAMPDGLTIGLPSIGTSWGEFGKGLSTDRPDSPTTTTSTSTSTTSTTTTTTTPATTTTFGISPGVDASDDTIEVDSDLVSAERQEFLDTLTTDDTRVADFRAEIAALTASDLPRLHYLHSLLPHVPWRLHGDGSTYVDAGLPGYFDMWDDDLDKAQFARQRHLLQLAFTDRLLGEYLDQLEFIGVFDQATVIVTADHGISFVPGKRPRGIGEANVAGIAGIPLFYKRPNQTEPSWETRPVETIDIVPTIAAQLDIELPWAAAGFDMFGAEPTGRERAVVTPFVWVYIPEPFAPVVAMAIDELHSVFGDGASGNVYALGGGHELIGQLAATVSAEPSARCWVPEPREQPEVDAADSTVTGYVTGWVDAPRGPAIEFAVVVDGIVAGTARTLDDGLPHRVFALGDPAVWQRSESPFVELFELNNGRLSSMRRC